VTAAPPALEPTGAPVFVLAAGSCTAPLDGHDRAALAAPDVRQVAAVLGYDLERPAPN
jgi:hypothetical protein